MLASGHRSSNLMTGEKRSRWRNTDAMDVEAKPSDIQMGCVRLLLLFHLPNDVHRVVLWESHILKTVILMLKIENVLVWREAGTAYTRGEEILTSPHPAIRGILAPDLVILDHGQMRTAPQLAPPLRTITPDQREDV
ncbi:hypothetical protein TNCV_3009441 [Trichonephila clavipes]|nr:hypothetical protein TNCV_3009441 [Trichonephila clavipes]